MGAGRLRPLLIAVFLALLPTSAHAHAEIVRAEPPADCGPRATSSFARDQPCPGGGVLPTAPREVRIIFSEPVAPVAGGISVLGPSASKPHVVTDPSLFVTSTSSHECGLVY